MTGQTISHYKILEKLGEGGMGVVYKAEDLKLKRIVAMKFLPKRLSVHGEERERFIQEAQAASALNHPNICVIHEIDEADGESFIVMEYMDGATLREWIRKKAEQAGGYRKSGIKEAVDLAAQIAEGLEKAHEKGIIHRDVKSDNIMVTADGRAKIMDFGLAKLKGVSKLTKTGSTVGTVAYMSPEQVEGIETDHRTDIFSFGVVVYEMLSNHLPFRAEHETAMMYEIINVEPQSLADQRRGIDQELDRIVMKCLEKEREERYQSMREVAVDLRRYRRDSEGRRIERKLEAPQVPDAARPSRNNIWIGVGGLVVLAVLALAYFLLKSGGQVSAARLNANMTMRVLPIPFTQFSYTGISPDGNWIVFPAPDANNRWDFYYMHISSSDPRRITVDSNSLGADLVADISPDGSRVAYARYDSNGVSQVCVTSVLGGARKILSDSAHVARWKPDGERIAIFRFQNPSKKAYYNLWSMKPDGSDSRLEFADTLGCEGRYASAWSPDGKSLAWIRSFPDGYQEVITMEIATGRERQLTHDKKNIDDVYWTKKEVIVFSSNRAGNTNLWMVPVEGGAPQQITKGGGPDIGISMSADGQKLVYLQQQRIGNVWSAMTDGSSAQQATFDEREIVNAEISPDGKQIALTMADVDPLKPSIYLFVQDRNGANRRQITSGETIALSPTWSPDGKWITFAMKSLTEPDDSLKIFIVDPVNSGAPRSIIPGDWAVWLNPDSFIAYRTHPLSCNEVTLQGGAPKPFFEDSTLAYSVLGGKRIFYQDGRKGKEGWWLTSRDHPADPMNPIRLFGAEIIIAGKTQNYVYYWDSRGGLWRLNFLTETKERLKGPFPGLGPTHLSVSRDDKEFLYITFKLTGKLVLIENLFE